MNKVLFTIVALLICGSAHAQLTIGKSAGQVMTENAITSSVVIIRQSYQVKNKQNGKVFGQNGRDDFGHTYSIGVKTEAGLALTECGLKPWLFDNAFKKVEQKYEPIVSLTEIRDIELCKDSSFSRCPLRIGRQQPEGLWLADAGAIAPNAMEIDNVDSEKDGWLIWFIAKKPLDEDPNAGISMQTLNKKITVSGADIEIDAPSGGSQVLGGLFVCPSYLGGGHVAYRLVGMTVKSEDKWLLRTPFSGFPLERTVTDVKPVEKSEPSQNEPSDEDSNENVKLTPIKDNKTTKK